MSIRSKCLKCGEEGTQVISAPKRKSPNLKYMRMYHQNGKVCYIGRVRTFDQAIGEFNKPQTLEDYEKAFKEIVRNIRELVNHYSNSLSYKNGSGSVRPIINRLRATVENYGY